MRHTYDYWRLSEPGERLSVHIESTHTVTARAPFDATLVAAAAARSGPREAAPRAHAAILADDALNRAHLRRTPLRLRLLARATTLNRGAPSMSGGAHPPRRCWSPAPPPARAHLHGPSV